jgi:anti-sigma factor RsiW
MTISCGRTRRILWPDAGLQEASRDVVEAREHLSRCTRCQDFFAHADSAPNLLKQIAAGEFAPLAVRQRLFAVIAEEHARPRFQRSYRSVSIAAAVAATIIVSTVLVTRRSQTPDPDQVLVAAIVADHGHSVGDGGINTAAASEASRWVAERVPYAVDVPAFPNARLERARITTVAERQAAVMEYKLAGQPLSYFVLPQLAADRGKPSEKLFHARLNGYQTVMWREPGMVHVLIGNISTSSLDQLALMCIAKSRRISSVGAVEKPAV